MSTKNQNGIATVGLAAPIVVMSTLKRGLLWMTTFASVLLGGVVMFGWRAGSVAITQIRPDFAAMQFNTALCFFLSGLSFWLVMTQKTKYSQFTLVLLFSISFPTLLQYISDTHFGIDLLFYNGPLLPQSLYPGRMSPVTASVFTIFSVAFFWVNLFSFNKRVVLLGEYVALMILTIGAISILGYLSGQNMVDSWHHFIQVAVHTSVGFCIIGLALFLVSQSQSQSQSQSFGRLLQTASVILFLLIAPLVTKSKLEVALFSILGGVLVAVFWQFHATLTKLIGNEEFTKSILNSVSDQVVVLNEHGVIVSANEKWREFSISNGVDYDQDPRIAGVGANYLEVCTQSRGPDSEVLDAKRASDGIRAVLEGRMPGFSLEYPCHAPKQKRWFNMVVTPLNSSGRGVVISHTNVTARKEAELELEANRTLLSSVLDNLPITVFAKNIKNNFQWILWNKSAECTFGLKAKDCLGKFDSDFFPKEQADFFRSKDIEASRSEELIDIPEEQAQTPKGQLTLHTKKVVIKDRDGQPSILLGITEDITMHKLQERKLKEANLKVTQASKLASLGEMSAGIAHEINNPLAIISGSIGLLSKFKDNPQKLASKIEAIQKSCDRITKIVVGLKKFSRSDEKRHFEFHCLSDITKEVATLIETKSKRHTTPVTIECSTSARILCDEVEIEQVLVNLINNGIDAVKDKSEKWVKILVFEDDLMVVMRVMDSGPGIPENVRAKLFDPFFTTKKVGEGTGLGLSISKGILDEHKATITVVADCPHTCFEIRFPRAEALKNSA